MTPPGNHAFVPLAPSTATNSKREDFHVLVAERPETARPLVDPNLTPSATSSSHPHRPACEPRVSLQREADCVTGIHIECSCGQIIDLKCAYQVNPPTPAPALPVPPADS